MKNIILLAAALFACACGAPDFVEEVEPTSDMQASCDLQCPEQFGTLGTNGEGTTTCKCSDDPPFDSSGELGELESALTMYTYSDHGIEVPSGKRCNVGVSQACRWPKYKNMKVKIMPHDYAGCWGEFWRDAIRDALTEWNALHTSPTFDTGFTIVEVTSGEHIRAYCDADHEDSGTTLGSYYPTDTVCSEWCWDGLGWIQCGFCQVKKANLILAGNNLVEAGANQLAIKNVAKHEFGHAFGLGHSSPYVGDDDRMMAPGPGLSQRANGTLYYPANHYQMHNTVFPTNYEIDLMWGYCPNGSTEHCD